MMSRACIRQSQLCFSIFFFNDTATTEIYTLSLHDALPISCGGSCACTTCHLYIKEGEQNLSEPEDKELDRLDTAWELRTNSRLGCQAVIKGGVGGGVPLYTAH